MLGYFEFNAGQAEWMQDQYLFFRFYRKFVQANQGRPESRPWFASGYEQF